MPWLELPVPLDELPIIEKPMQTFEFVGPLHAMGTTSGFPVVDVVVDAAMRGDREALLSHVGGSSGSSALLGGAGIVIAGAEDAGSFARALDRLTAASLRARLGARGRELALGQGWNRHIEKLRTLYARVRS